MCKWCQSKTSTEDFCSLECKEKFRNFLEKRIAQLQSDLAEGKLSADGMRRLQDYTSCHNTLMEEVM